MAVLSVALYLGEKSVPIWSPRIVIFIAIIIRLLFLFRHPELSDDIYRYLWDGATMLNGHNPYSLPPAAAQPFDAETSRLLKLVNHPHLITIYPPVAQIVFAAGSLLGGYLGLKSLLVTLDIATCLIVVKVLSIQKLPTSRAVMYAWHPLPVLEIASSGHIDGAAIFFMMLAILFSIARLDDKPDLFIKDRFLAPLAGLLFSFALMVNLFPVVLFPAYLHLTREKRKTSFVLAMIAGGGVLLFPFLPDLSNMFVTLGVYLHNWEFAGFAYKTIQGVTSSGHVARLVLAAFFLVILAISYAALFLGKKNSAINQPQNFLFLPALKTMYGITLAFLLLTPTLHPWYALYLVCLLPFVPGAAGIVLSWAVLLSYRVLIPFMLLGTWSDNDIIPGLIWGATIAATLVTALVKKRSLRY